VTKGDVIKSSASSLSKKVGLWLSSITLLESFGGRHLASNVFNNLIESETSLSFFPNLHLCC
jgi:hypothetical protein